MFADALMPGPYQCYICDEEDLIGEDGLCDACRSKLKYYPSPVCSQPLDGIAIGLQYGEEIATAVLRFKKNDMREYGAFLAQYLSVPSEWKADILVPVPIHPLKLWLRHMQNHTETLAAYLSHATGIPYSTELLTKTRFTGEQKKLRDPAQRRRNIRGSFSAENRGESGEGDRRAPALCGERAAREHAERGEAAHYERIRKNLENAVHPLDDRIRRFGAGMGDRR